MQIIKLTEEAITPTAKLFRLIDIVSTELANESAFLEIGLRAWAHQEDEVRQLIAKVDSQRIAYVKNLLFEIFNDEAKALLVSQMFYTILIGSEHIIPPFAQTHLKTYLTEFLHLYGVNNE